MDGPFWVDLRAPHMSADAAQVTFSVTTAKALLTTANLPILGANYFSYIGKAVRIRMVGRITTVAGVGSITASLYWGSGADANGTIVATSAAVALTASQTNLTWELELYVRCRALGATGSLLAYGMLNANVAVLASTLQPVMIPASAAAPTTVDLTQNFVLSPNFAIGGTTGSTATVHDFMYEALN